MIKFTIYDCVIIGAGPAGYSAAIYAGRADLNFLLFTGIEPGGQLTTTTEVENFPGYPKGVTGIQLMDNFKKQAKRFNTVIKEQCITKVSFLKENGSIHSLYTEIGEKIQTKGVIIATGASPKYLGLKNEKRLKGSGVSTCATCDGFFFRTKIVAVIGGGDSALEESIYLSKICKKVYLIVRKGYLSASKARTNNIKNILNLKIFFFHEIKNILGKNIVEGIIILNKKNYKESILYIEGLFIAIGQRPNTSIFKDQIPLNKSGFILIKKGLTGTNLPGIFAAGDVQDSIYRQAITAASSGCMAALDLDRYLFSLNKRNTIN